ARDRLHNGRRPLVAAHRKRLQRANLTFHELSAFAVTFINDENVGDLHDSGFDGLHIVAHAGDEDHNGDIGHAHYVNFILADANGFNHDEVAAGGVEHSGYVGGCDLIMIETVVVGQDEIDEVAAGGVEHSGYVGGCASQSA